MRILAILQEPDSGRLFAIELLFASLCQMLQAAGLRVDGLFLNADADGRPLPFDSTPLRTACWQHEIQANIWPNPHVLAFCTLFMGRLASQLKL